MQLVLDIKHKNSKTDPSLPLESTLSLPLRSNQVLLCGEKNLLKKLTGLQSR